MLELDTTLPGSMEVSSLAELSSHVCESFFLSPDRTLDWDQPVKKVFQSLGLAVDSLLGMALDSSKQVSPRLGKTCALSWPCLLPAAFGWWEEGMKGVPGISSLGSVFLLLSLHVRSLATPSGREAVHLLRGTCVPPCRGSLSPSWIACGSSTTSLSCCLSLCVPHSLPTAAWAAQTAEHVVTGDTEWPWLTCASAEQCGLWSRCHREAVLGQEVGSFGVLLAMKAREDARPLWEVGTGSRLLLGWQLGRELQAGHTRGRLVLCLLCWGSAGRSLGRNGGRSTRQTSASCCAHWLSEHLTFCLVAPWRAAWA